MAISNTRTVSKRRTSRICILSNWLSRTFGFIPYIMYIYNTTKTNQFSSQLTTLSISSFILSYLLCFSFFFYYYSFSLFLSLELYTMRYNAIDLPFFFFSPFFYPHFSCSDSTFCVTKVVPRLWLHVFSLDHFLAFFSPSSFSLSYTRLYIYIYNIHSLSFFFSFHHYYCYTGTIRQKTVHGLRKAVPTPFAFTDLVCL